MRYEVRLSDSPPLLVNVEDRPGGGVRAFVGSNESALDVVRIGSTFSFIIGGRVIEVARHRLKAQVTSERSAAGVGKGASRGVDKLLKSPMPGRIVKVSVSEGDEVAVGTPLLVVEAMKMENELRAKGAGTVDKIFVRPGQAVEANAQLLSFK